RQPASGDGVGERGLRVVVEQPSGGDEPARDGIGDGARHTAQLGAYLRIEILGPELLVQFGDGLAARLPVAARLAVVPRAVGVLAAGVAQFDAFAVDALDVDALTVDALAVAGCALVTGIPVAGLPVAAVEPPCLPVAGREVAALVAAA